MFLMRPLTSCLLFAVALPAFAADRIAGRAFATPRGRNRPPLDDLANGPGAEDRHRRRRKPDGGAAVVNELVAREIGDRKGPAAPAA